MRHILNAFIAGVEIIKTFRNWPIVLLLRFFELFTINLLYIGPYTACTLRNGVKFKVRTNPKDNDDAGMILNIWVEKYHQFSRENIADNNLVIDIGAHIGIFSVMAATLANNVKVYAYEPEPENFRLLQHNIKLNGLENHIVPFNFAMVGDSKDRKRKLFVGSSTSLRTYSLFPIKQDDKYIVTDCLTLEDVFVSNGIERCDFLKIDCEGSEYEILFSTPKEYLDKIRKIHLEYHEGPGINYNRHDLADFLRQAGFDVALKPDVHGLGLIYGERTVDTGKE